LQHLSAKIKEAKDTSRRDGEIHFHGGSRLPRHLQYYLIFTFS
jgi:hypothetical protein